jgi:hypothetical protein
MFNKDWLHDKDQAISTGLVDAQEGVPAKSGGGGAGGKGSTSTWHQVLTGKDPARHSATRSSGRRSRRA